MKTINTNMRNAFIKLAGKMDHPVITSCLNTRSEQRQPGQRHAGRGWTASLSVQTTKKLIREKVFA